MYKTYSIRADLDNFLKSKKTNHDTLIKTLFGRSKKVNTKTDLLTYLSDHPEDIESFKTWMRDNGGKTILDKINDIASESAVAKENKEDQKLNQAWSKMGAEDGDSSNELKNLKRFVKQMFQSQEKKNEEQDKKIEDQNKQIEGLSRRVAAQGMHIEKLKRELDIKKQEVKLLIQQVQNMEQKLQSANIDKNKLVEELREERRQKGILARILEDKFPEIEKRMKAVMDDYAKLEKAVRAETEHKVISETGRTLEDEFNVQALNAKALEEELLQLSADCKEINDDVSISSDDAANLPVP